MSLNRFLENQLKKRRRTGHLRSLKNPSSLIDFSSNDYLGLARHPEIQERIRSYPSCGHGSTGSRLLSGNTDFANDLEKNIAAFHGFEAALLYTCGYLANMGVLSALTQPKDLILYDTHIHASSREGIRLSRAEARPWQHNCIEDLKQKLEERKAGAETFVCVESVYSADGSLAPLRSIVEMCERYGAHLIVDEAHAVGVFGKEGRGWVEENGLTSRVFAQIVTFGKALGVHGAAVLGTELLKEYLINFSRPLIYTTALPLHNLLAIDASYSLLPKLEKERAHLRKLIAQLGLSRSPIQPYFVKHPEEAERSIQLCREKGIEVRPLLRPTVLRGYESLRICLHAFNTSSEVDLLLNLLPRRIR